MKIFFCSLLLLLIPVAQAEQLAPDVLVNRSPRKSSASSRRTRTFRQATRKKAADLMENKIVPHFNFVRMTRIAMGRNWRPRPRRSSNKELVGEFKTLLVRTYSTALAHITTDQQIDYKPCGAKLEDTEVTVRSDVKQSGFIPSRFPSTTRWKRLLNGWKVYDDVKVGGVSLVHDLPRHLRQRNQGARTWTGLINPLAAKKPPARALESRQT